MPYEEFNQVDRGDGLHEIIYSSDSKHFFLQIVERDNTNKKTKIKSTPILNAAQTTPTDWTAEEWVTDEYVEEYLEEAMSDPLADFLWWLLRMIARKNNRPIG